MSETLTVGVVGPSYWSYTAAVMTNHLGQVINQRATDPPHLLNGVYLNAKEFFRIVLEAMEEAIPDNPCASLANYKIATDTLLKCVRPRPSSVGQIDALLRQYAQFLGRLEMQRSLTEEEAMVASKVRDFFAQLTRDGDEEEYVNAVRFEPPGLGLTYPI